MEFLQTLLIQFGIYISAHPLVVGSTLLILCIIQIALLISIFKLSRRISYVFRGKHGASMEHTLTDLIKTTQEFDTWRTHATDIFKDIDTRLQKSLTGTALIRFNPFKGTGSGGNQSFATALLSEQGDGIIISSLYSRDRVSIFGKPIQKFTSSFELTHEEKQAIKDARKHITP